MAAGGVTEDGSGSGGGRTFKSEPEVASADDDAVGGALAGAASMGADAGGVETGAAGGAGGGAAFASAMACAFLG